MRTFLLLAICLGVLFLSGCAEPGVSEENEGESWTRKEFVNWLIEKMEPRNTLNKVVLEADQQSLIISRKTRGREDGALRVKTYDTGRDAADTEEELEYVWGRFGLVPADQTFSDGYWSSDLVFWKDVANSLERDKPNYDIGFQSSLDALGPQRNFPPIQASGESPPE